MSQDLKAGASGAPLGGTSTGSAVAGSSIVPVFNTSTREYEPKTLPSGGGGASVESATLDSAASVPVTGPISFVAIDPSLQVSIEALAGDVFTAQLVINTSSNISFAVGLRITYSDDGGMSWNAVPGASLLDEDTSINRMHLSVLGQFIPGTDIPALLFRAEWTAYGDSGTWACPGDQNGSATLMVTRA